METAVKYLDLEMDESWKKIRSELKSKLGQDIYKNWIEVLSLLKIESQVAYFNVPSSFIANWIDSNYRDQIIDSFNNGKATIFEPGLDDLIQTSNISFSMYLPTYIKYATFILTHQ